MGLFHCWPQNSSSAFQPTFFNSVLIQSMENKKTSVLHTPHCICKRAISVLQKPGFAIKLHHQAHRKANKTKQNFSKQQSCVRQLTCTIFESSTGPSQTSLYHIHKVRMSQARTAMAWQALQNKHWTQCSAFHHGWRGNSTRFSPGSPEASASVSVPLSNHSNANPLIRNWRFSVPKWVMNPTGYTTAIRIQSFVLWIQTENHTERPRQLHSKEEFIFLHFCSPELSAEIVPRWKVPTAK